MNVRRLTALLVILFGNICFAAEEGLHVGDQVSGQAFKIEFTNAPTHEKAWIGIYPKGVKSGSKGSTQWSYTEAKTAGELMFKGLAAGSYEARLFKDGGYTELKVVGFTVSDVKLTIDESLNPAIDGSWPTYMANNERNGFTTTKLKLPLKLQWVRNEQYPPRPAWPKPALHDYFHKKFNLSPRVVYDRAFHLIAGSNKLFRASSADDSVVCLDLAVGREIWKFYAEGPVRLAPTLAAGKVLFGSDDGYAYCLDEEDGKLIWKQRISDKRAGEVLPGNARLISRFPIRSGILVRGEEAYFTSGMFPEEGVFYGKVNLRDGKIIDSKPINQSTQGYLAERDNQVFSPTGRVSKGAWLDKLSRRGSVSNALRNDIDETYPFCSVGNEEYVIRGGVNEIALFSRENAQKLWTQKIDGQAYSIIIAYGKLLVSTDKGIIYCFGEGAIENARQVAAKPAVIANDELEQAQQIVEICERRKGYALLLNRSADSALALARQSDFEIIVRESDPAKIDSGRLAVESHNLANRIHFHAGDASNLPYVESCFNLIVAGSTANKDALMKIVRPGGGVLKIAGQQAIIKEALAGSGEWTHFYGDAANTACSGDQLVNSSQLELQWFGAPGPRNMVDRHNRGPAPLYHQGNLYVSGQDFFAGVDAYNGTILWQRTIENSMRLSAFKSAGNMAAANGNLFLTAGSEGLMLGGLSGDTKHNFKTPSAGDWNYIAVQDGRLYGSTTIKDALKWQQSPTSWKIGYSQNTAFICSHELFNYDFKNKQLKATYESEGVILTPSITLSEDTIFFLENQDSKLKSAYEKNQGHMKLRGDSALVSDHLYLIALEAKSFKLKWKTPVNSLKIEQSLAMLYKDGRVLICGSRVSEKIGYELSCFSASDGKQTWSQSVRPREQDSKGSHGELVQHGAIVGGIYYISNAAVNMSDGKLKSSWDWNRGQHGCGTFSASASHMFWRGTNPRMCALGEKFAGEAINSISRPGCWINIIPAGGMVLIPEGSSGCSCNFPIQTSLAYRPKK